MGFISRSKWTSWSIFIKVSRSCVLDIIKRKDF